MQTLASRIASDVGIINASQSQNHIDMAKDRLKLLADRLPSGAGFDNGSEIDMDKTTSEKLVINTAFHHMNDTGYYVGWTNHVVTVKASFLGLDIKISGSNRNDIKNYIGDVFYNVLSETD